MFANGTHNETHCGTHDETHDKSLDETHDEAQDESHDPTEQLNNGVAAPHCSRRVFPLAHHAGKQTPPPRAIGRTRLRGVSTMGAA